MSMWQIYWLTRLFNLQSALSVIAVVFGFSTFLFGISMVTEFKEKEKGIYKYWAKQSLTAFVSSMALFIFLPSKSDVAIMVAGSWATNSEEMKKLPDNVVKTINDFLSEHQSHKENKDE